MASRNHDCGDTQNDNRGRFKTTNLEHSWRAIVADYKRKIKHTKESITQAEGALSIVWYVQKFNLAAINQPISGTNKVFQLEWGFGSKYQNFLVVMLSKQPYPSLNQFILSLKSNEQKLKNQKMENKILTNYAHAFFGQIGPRRNGRGGSRFNSRV